METQYLLNSMNHIVSVGGQWDEFAADNNAADAMKHKVVGKSIWDCIGDANIKDYLDEIFTACRSQRKPVYMFFRCGIEKKNDLFKFSELADIDDNILVGAKLIPNTFNLLGPKVITSENDFDVTSHVCCASCHALKYKDVWINLFPLESENEIGINYTICPDCALVGNALISIKHHLNNFEQSRLIQLESGSLHLTCA